MLLAINIGHLWSPHYAQGYAPAGLFNFSIFKALHCRAKFVVTSPFSLPSDFREEFEYTHMHTHTYIREPSASNKLHGPVLLHTRTQQLRGIPNEKEILSLQLERGHRV